MSELRADTITGSDGTSPVTLTKQSAAKAWANLDGASLTDPASLTGVNDSFNIASVLDDGLGDYTLTYTSAMSNANYASMGANNTIIQDQNRPTMTVPEAQTTTTLGLRNAGTHNNNTYYDIDPTMALVHGDLA